MHPASTLRDFNQDRRDKPHNYDFLVQISTRFTTIRIMLSYATGSAALSGDSPGGSYRNLCNIE